MVFKARALGWYI